MTFNDKATAYTAAWNSADLAAVAAHFVPNAQIVINRGDPSKALKRCMIWQQEFMRSFRIAN